MKKYYLLGLTILIAICSCFGLLANYTKVENNNVLADGTVSSICVLGGASTEVSPDCAKISASIETLSTNLTEAKDKNFEILNSAVNKLIELGINKENIITEYFSAYPSYDYSCERTLKGYSAITYFTFKVDNLDDIKSYIDELTQCGVTSIKNINYEISNYDEIYSQTMLNALENAKLKAKELSGREEIQILSINEEYVYCSSNLYRSYSDGMVDNDLVGKVTISAKLKVEFALN